MAGKAVIDGIEKKVAHLIAENSRLRSENGRLMLSREKLRDENNRLLADMAVLERSLTVKELAEGFAGETADRKGAKTARARVNRLMREVDKCIGLLNKEA